MKKYLNSIFLCAIIAFALTEELKAITWDNFKVRKF